MRRLLSLAPAFVAVLFPFISVQACGPFFFDDVFVRSLRPDHPKLFAQGKLRVLRPTYPRADLTVAYRYLNGGSLTPEEQKAYKPTLSLAEIQNEATTDDAELGRTGSSNYAEPPGAADEWLSARNKYAFPQPEIHPIGEIGRVYPIGMLLAGNYENCQADAFHTAVITLQSRAKTGVRKAPNSQTGSKLRTPSSPIATWVITTIVARKRTLGPQIRRRRLLLHLCSFDRIAHINRRPHESMDEKGRVIRVFR